jgi:Large polyvalent protein-associated domain 1
MARKIEDAGEKIGGARKDFHNQAMQLEDLQTMTAAEAVSLIKKDNVWPVPEYASLVEEGMEPRVAALVKIIRDRIAAKPNVTRGLDALVAGRHYVEMLGLIRDALLQCKTFNDLKNVDNEIIVCGIPWKQGWKEPDIRHRVVSIMKSGASRTPTSLGYEDIRRADSMLAEGFPDDVPAWRRGVKARPYGKIIMLVKGGKVIGPDFQDEEAAWAWLKTTAETKAEAKRTARAEDKIPPGGFKRPHLDKLERFGPDVRKEKDVSPQDFIDIFGFRGVEFGNWLDDNERQQVLNMAYDAFHDMSDFLGIPLKGISLYGTLSMGFGSRGQGGLKAAAAHYEPGRRVFNLTKLRGAGSLAHEWMHALDHYLGVMGGGELEGSVPRFASGNEHWKSSRKDALANLEPGMLETIDTLLHVMKWVSMNRDDAIINAKKILDDAESKVAKASEMIKNYQNSLTDGRRPDNKWFSDAMKYMSSWRKEVEKRQNTLASIESKQPEDNFGEKTSSYMEQALILAKGEKDGYHAQPTEMMARAFECAVYDWLRENNRKSDYLVHGVAEGIHSVLIEMGLSAAEPYPTGQERKKINAAIDTMITAFTTLPLSLREGEEEIPSLVL